MYNLVYIFLEYRMPIMVLITSMDTIAYLDKAAETQQHSANLLVSFFVGIQC